MVQEVLADEMQQVNIVVAEDVDGTHRRHAVEQRQIVLDAPAEIALPEIEKVSGDNQSPGLIADEIEKAAELLGPVAIGEAVAGTAIAQVQVGNDKSLHVDSPKERR
jgi:hypothetical protein